MGELLAHYIGAKKYKASEAIKMLSQKNTKLDDYLSGDIYCNRDKEYISQAKDRLLRTIELHKQMLGDREVYILRAPGRLNAFLEYMDMCGGDHMSTTIDGDICVCLSLRRDDRVVTFNCSELFQDDEFGIAEEHALFHSAPWDTPQLNGLADNWDMRTRAYPHHGHMPGDWMNYVRGPFLKAATELAGAQLKGVEMTFGPSTIPLRGGTSSSSAIVVLSTLALALANRELFADWPIEKVCAFMGEAEWYVGTHGGANDQTTILRNKPNGILYNRHSREELESTPVPGLRGVKWVIAHSLWEAAKSLNAKYIFNLRKGWMDLGDDLLRLIINLVECHLDSGAETDPGWIARIINDAFGYDPKSTPYSLETKTEQWPLIFANYKKFGSLDQTILQVSHDAIDELVELLPEEISPKAAARILDKSMEEMARDYTLPNEEDKVYRPRSAAKFFHKQNRLGREIEKILTEAESRVCASELHPKDGEYEEYQARVGRILQELQKALRDDFQVSNNQLDLLLTIAKNAPGYLGGKLTGAGSGGCVVVMVKDGLEDDFCNYLDEHYYGKDENFSVYRSAISELENEFADELVFNLNSALKDHKSQRNVVTFGAGARFLVLDW